MSQITPRGRLWQTARKVDDTIDGLLECQDVLEELSHGGSQQPAQFCVQAGLASHYISLARLALNEARAAMGRAVD